MAQHYHYMENVSFTQMVRTIKDFLTSMYPPTDTTLLWELLYESDPDPTNDFSLGPIVYIMRKKVAASVDAYIYVKLIMDGGTLTAIISPAYDATADENGQDVLTHAFTSHREDNNNEVIVRDLDGNLVTPSNVKLCQLVTPQGFDVATQTFSRVWLIRKINPLFDDVNIDDRKATDLFFWLSMVREESLSSPIDIRGYYQHFSFGACGEILTADASMENGPGLYVTSGSFCDPADNIEETSTRYWCGSGDLPNKPLVGSYLCTGLWEGKINWFIPANMYGYGRSPFDSDILASTPHVGFDFTELCKYSTYAGVRVLTPSYGFGMYDGLWRIIARFPFYYTDLTGLYAGDIITHTNEDGTEKSFMIFPFSHYSCGDEIEARRGYAVPLQIDT